MKAITIKGGVSLEGNSSQSYRLFVVQEKLPGWRGVERGGRIGGRILKGIMKRKNDEEERVGKVVWSGRGGEGARAMIDRKRYGGPYNGGLWGGANS